MIALILRSRYLRVRMQRRPSKVSWGLYPYKFTEKEPALNKPQKFLYLHIERTTEMGNKSPKEKQYYNRQKNQRDPKVK